MAEQRAGARPTDPATLLATWFGAGFLPVAPGSWGSLTALPCAALLVWLGGPVLVLAAGAALFVLGIWAADAYMQTVQVHDPAAIVIDEVVGQWVTLALLPLDPAGVRARLCAVPRSRRAQALAGQLHRPAR